MEWWAAISIGLFGSLHCVGMCGPIALALPISHRNLWLELTQTSIYHFGRILMYGLIGLLAGLMSQGAIVAGIQMYVSIVAGLILIIGAILSISIESQILRWKPLAQLFFQIKKKLGVLLQQNSRWALFQMGILNGLLPCGLVYVAVLGALLTSSYVEGFTFMVLFGFGTLPLLFLFSLLGHRLQFSFKNRLRQFYPTFLILLGIFFIIRGIALELPQDLRLWDALPMCH